MPSVNSTMPSVNSTMPSVNLPVKLSLLSTTSLNSYIAAPVLLLLALKRSNQRSNQCRTSSTMGPVFLCSFWDSQARSLCVNLGTHSDI